MYRKAIVSALLFCCTLFGKAQPWRVSFTIGINSPLVDDGDQLVKTLYQDESGQLKPGVLETKGSLLVTPLRLASSYQISQRFFLGVSALFQAHTEREILRNTLGEFVSENQTTQTAFLTFADVNYMWVDAKSISLVSGVGLGYGWSSLQNTSGQGLQGFCFDIKPIAVHYKLCCGWTIFLDTRYTSSPTGLDKIAGYNVGLGVSYTL